jgi:hypothetical protein
MDTINFAGAVAVLLFIIAAVSSVFDTYEQKLEAAKDCENRGGVYIDNMRRVGKSTTHEYMCMKKSLFVDMEEK